MSNISKEAENMIKFYRKTRLNFVPVKTLNSDGTRRSMFRRSVQPTDELE